MNARVLVTGGAGFIGSHLISKLLNRNHEVLAIDNLFVGKREQLPSGCEFENIDITSDEIKNIVKEFKPDIIIHLAALHYIPYCNDHPEKTFEVNILGTRNLLESYNPKLFFFSSSAAVYPKLDIPLSEEIFGPIDIYGKTKLIGEDLVKLFSKKYIIGRFFNVYGNNDNNPHIIPEIISQIKYGRRRIKLGNLTPKRDYIHVDDVTDAIIELIDKAKPGTYNIGTGNQYSVTDIIKLISQILEEEITIVQERGKIRKVERENLIANINKITMEINWQPKIRFIDGLTKLIDK